MIGRTLSHYRIVEPLGAGGMGEVYRARDEKLGRDVAVKVLPADALTDEAARRRFQKEAEALVRLSHPHIATVFDVDSAEGTDFIVMEVVPGPTLKERLQEGPLREKEVVRLGTQLVRGLMAAHEKGIVHRDLKPSNLSLTEDGLLKILDFGLMRLLQAEPGGAGETAPTETAAGRAAGTLPYMSPEQLRGRGVDARSDLYAVGAVLFELATGRRVFEPTNEVELADAILHEPPPSPRSVKSTLSPGLEAIVLKALDKDPELRYQTAREMLVDLERLQVGSSAGSGSGDVSIPEPRRRRRRAGVWIATAGVIVVLALAAWFLWPVAPPRVLNVRPVTSGVAPVSKALEWPTWATDGSQLYYTDTREGRAALFHVPVSGGDPTEVPLPFTHEARILDYLESESALLMTGAERDVTTREGPLYPFWLVRVPTGGPRRIGDLRAEDATVSPDESRLACARGSEIFLYDLGTGQETPLLDESDWVHGITWAPGSRRLRYVRGPDADPWIWETTIDGAPPRRLWRCSGFWGSGPTWSADGRHFLFSRPSDSSGRMEIFAVRDAGVFPWRQTEPLQLTFGPVEMKRGVVASPDGTTLFAYGDLQKGELVRFDREQRRFVPVLEGVSAEYADVSPDGDWIAWTSLPGGTLWRSRLDGRDRLQLTGPGLAAASPRWSPDGQSIAFHGWQRGEAAAIYVVSSQGGKPERLSPKGSELPHVQPCWLPDGRTILFSYRDVRDPQGIYQVDVPTRQISVLPGTEDLKYPKCGPGGMILGQRVGGQTAGPAVSVFRPDVPTWEPLEFSEQGHWPTLTRDGQRFCQLSLPATDAIVCYSLADGSREVVVEMDEPLLGVFPYMTLDANDDPIVIRDRSTREIYALEWEAP